MANEVEIDLLLKTREATKAAGRFASKINKEFDSVTRGFLKIDGALGSFVGNIGANAATGAVRLFGNALSELQSQFGGIVDASRDLEVIETQFRTLLGSAEAAAIQLRDLQEFAASTPFQIQGLSRATNQLISFGVAQQDVIPTLTRIGDIAAGVGAQIDDLTIPYGRLISTQKLTLVELDKFADRGVNLYAKLSDQTGISLQNIRDEISKGRVPFEEFTRAIEDLTSEGGTFFNGMQSQSKTLSGVISTLKDNFFNLQATIGATFRPALIVLATTLTEQLQKMQRFFQDNGVNIFKGAIDSLSGSLITFSEIAQNVRLFFDFIDDSLIAGAQLWTQLGISILNTVEAAKQLVGLKLDEDSIRRRDALLLELEALKMMRQEKQLESFEKIQQNESFKESVLTTTEEITSALDQQALANEALASRVAIANKKIKDSTKDSTDKQKGFWEELYASTKANEENRIQNFRSTLTTISSLSAQGNSTLFNIGKAAAASNATIDGIAAVQKALASAPPPFNFALAAVVGAATAANVAKIASQKAPAFEQGGIVPGNSYSGDNVMARVNSGEMMLNRQQQSMLFQSIASGSIGGNQPIVIEIDGREIARANRNAINEGFAA